MRKAMVAAMVVVCGACGGGSIPASVTGTVGGQSMSGQDAVFNTIAVSGGTQGLILITNASSTCAKLTANQQPRNAKAIAIGIGTATASTVSAPTSTGDYLISGSGGNVSIASYVATDANCNPTAQVDATAGKVTLTHIDSNGYSGTFDLTFSASDHLQGSFNASKCPALSANIGGTCT